MSSYCKSVLNRSPFVNGILSRSLQEAEENQKASLTTCAKVSYYSGRTIRWIGNIPIAIMRVALHTLLCKPPERLISLQRDMAEIYSAMHRQFSWIRNPQIEDLSSGARVIIPLVEEKAEPARIRLVASLFGRLYDPNCGWGKLWTLFYRVLGCFVGDRYRHTKVQGAIRNFFENYQALQGEIAEDVLKVQKCLHASFTTRTDLRECLPEMQKIRRIHAMIHPFIKLMRRHVERTTTLFSEFSADPFIVHDNFLWCREIHHLTNLMDLSEGTIPLFSIANLWRKLDSKEAKEKKAKSGDEEEHKQLIQEWLNKTFHSNLSIPIHEWQKKWKNGVRSIIWLDNYCRTENRYDAPTLGRLRTTVLGIFLEIGCSRRICSENKCNRAFEPDPRHLQWRSQLHQGSQISFNGKQITLGAPIDQNPKADFHVFNVLNRPELIVRIATNRLKLEYMKYELEKKESLQFSVYPVVCQEVDRHGRVAIFEKVAMLDQIKWEVEENEKLAKMSPSDLLQADAIAEAIAKMIRDSKYSPVPLTINSLGFDPVRRQLIAVRPFKQGAFDFDAVEEIFAQICRGNAEIFKHLMKKSNMHNCGPAKFYSLVVRDSLRGITIDFDNPTMLASFRIANYTKKVIENGKVLRQSILSLRDRCCESLQAITDKAEPKMLKADVNEELLFAYMQYGGSKLLEKSLMNEICSRVAEKRKLVWAES